MRTLPLQEFESRLGVIVIPHRLCSPGRAANEAAQQRQRDDDTLSGEMVSDINRRNSGEGDLKDRNPQMLLDETNTRQKGEERDGYGCDVIEQFHVSLPAHMHQFGAPRRTPAYALPFQDSHFAEVLAGYNHSNFLLSTLRVRADTLLRKSTMRNIIVHF